MNKAKLDHRLASSNLRILLNHPQIASGVERFKRVYFCGTDYIYNTRRGNIIATIRQSNTKTLLRYRPASYYASILEEFGNRSGYVTIASTNVGRAQRRIAREEGNTSAMDRKYALKNLALKLKKPKLHDALSPSPNPNKFLIDHPQSLVQSIEDSLTSFSTDSSRSSAAYLAISIDPRSQTVTTWGHVIRNEDNRVNVASIDPNFLANYRIHEGVQYMIDAQGLSMPANPLPHGGHQATDYSDVFQPNYLWRRTTSPFIIDEADQTTESS